MFFVKILTKLHISAIIIKKTERQRENMNSDLYWIWFSLVSENFRAKSRKIYKNAKNIKDIYNADVGQYVNWGITDIRYLTALADKSLVDAEKELWFAENYNTEIIACDSEKYPEKLCQLTDLPLMVYKRGTAQLDNKNGISVAIVGTRKASQNGKNSAYKTAFALAKNGIRIISGMAEGIDTFAHMGALDAGGETVAVFGCSVATAFPASNKELMQKIAEHGCICSEYGFEQTVYPSNFSARNRIVSALSDAVIVIEAGEKSGSLITAKLAAKHGKKLFVAKDAVINNNNNLFEDIEYILIDSPDDVLEYFNISHKNKEIANTEHTKTSSEDTPQIDPKRKKVLNFLATSAADEEEITVALKENPVETGVLLTMMEIENLIIRRPDGKYTINS